MGLETATLAAIGLAVSAGGAVMQASAQSDAKKAQRNAAEEQRKVRAEEKAQLAAKAANERRQQIREERVRRAQVIQSSENTGVSGSSGEMGATANLATQLGANIGYNVGAIASANKATQYAQNSADFLGSAQNSMSRANTWGSVGGLGTSIFSSSGGFNAFSDSQAPAPVQHGPSDGGPL